MTRQFNQHVNCPECGHEFSAESAFCSWMRRQKILDSQDGIVRADMDHIIHRYTFPAVDRNVQAIMLIEVKTHVDFNKNQFIKISQADTLWIVDQILRNRKANIHSQPRRQSGSTCIKAYSFYKRRYVCVRFYGVHGLYFSKTNPEDSKRIDWDKHRNINSKQLLKLLRFELDPDTLKPIDLRIHQKKENLLFEYH